MYYLQRLYSFLTFCSGRKHTFRNYTQCQSSSFKGLPKQINQLINKKLADNYGTRLIAYTLISRHKAISGQLDNVLRDPAAR